MVLLKVLRKTKQKEKELRLLMLGLDNAGKTTIVKRINGDDWDTVSPTLGFSISTFAFQG
ncbi:ADP-ribosylation factor-like protein 2, partial [Toxoplasma gondii FOU]